MRRTIRLAGPAAALVFGTTLGACAPVLSHGPRVREGTSVGASVAVFETLDNEAFTAVIPYLTAGERDEDGTATQFTMLFVIPAEGVFEPDAGSAFMLGAQMDYYREMTSDNPSMARGWGIHGSLFQLMPYRQWGIYSDRLGIFTTQGVGTVGPYLGLPPEGVFWSPGVGVEYDGDGFMVRSQVSAMVLGTIRGGERFVELPVTVGFTVQFGERSPADSGRVQRAR